MMPTNRIIHSLFSITMSVISLAPEVRAGGIDSERVRIAHYEFLGIVTRVDDVCETGPED